MDGDSKPKRIRVRIDGHDYDVTPEYALRLRQRGQSGLGRSGIPSPGSSSARGTDSRRRSEDATQTRVRQSSMYSDRPRRSRRNQGRAQPSSNFPAVEVAAEGSSNELGSTIADVSKLETLSLSDSPSTLDPTDGDVVHPGATGSERPDSTIMVPSPVEESLSPKSERLRELEVYFQTHTFDNMDDAFEYICNIDRAFLAALSQQSAQDKPESGSELAPEQESELAREEQAGSVLAPEQSLSFLGEGRCSEASDEETAENGKQWMRGEVMVAFAKYTEDKDEFKGTDYEFGELQHQCFSVENYYKIFHHFNFTVKMRAHGSADWTSELFFAEVKEILRQKFYFCSPLEPDENGHCYACKMQGMDDLRHPIIGVYDRGDPDTAFPLIYGGGTDGFMYD